MRGKKVIIIGGGIGGLITSIALKKKGINSIIFEKASSNESNGAGLALWANATSILEKFGLLVNLLSHCCVLDKIKTSTSNGTNLNEVNIKKLEDRFHSPSIVLLRQTLQTILLAEIPSSEINYNKLCVKIEKGLNEVKVYFNDGTTETADAAIFADGAHSIARKSVFKHSPLKYAGRISWRGVAQFGDNYFSDYTSFEILGYGKRIGIFPLPNNQTYWYAAVNMSIEEASKQKRTIDSVLSHFIDWVEPVKKVINNTNEDRLILTNIKYSSDIKTLVTNNIALLGDAAHPMTPDLGQGACQAIEDAYILAECLSENYSIETGLKKYENLRLQRVKSIALNSYRIGQLRQIENPIGVALRNNILKFLPETFALKMLEKNIKFTLNCEQKK